MGAPDKDTKKKSGPKAVPADGAVSKSAASKTGSGKTKTDSAGKVKAGSAGKIKTDSAGKIKSAKATGSGVVKGAKTPSSGAVRERSSATVPVTRANNSSYVFMAIGLVAVGVVAGAVILSSGSPSPAQAADATETGASDAPGVAGGATIHAPRPRNAAAPTAVANEPTEQGRNALAQGRLEMKAGNYDKALEAFAIGEHGGVDKGELATLRAKCQELIAADKKWRSLVAHVKELEAAGSFDDAAEMLRLADPLALQLGHEADLKDLVKECAAAQGKTGNDVLDIANQVHDALALGDLKKAQELAAPLKVSNAGDPAVVLMLLQIDRVAKTPAGTNYVEIDASTARGVYVPRKPVSNADWKLWSTSLASDARPRAPWPGGDFPAEEAAFPVVGVRQADAVLFAKARGGRLPTVEELAVMRVTLRLSAIENSLEGELFTGSFRFVIEPGASAPAAVATPTSTNPEAPVAGPEAGGARPVEAKPTRATANLERDLKDRTKAWLEDREHLVCQDCHGKGWEPCRGCDGKGYIEGTSVTHPTKCPNCHGDTTIPCSRKCKKGLSRTMLERTTKRFGTLGQALKHAKPGITPSVKLDAADPTRATVVSEVQYLSMADGYCNETSVWQFDSKTNAWMCTGVTDSVKKDD